MWATLQFRVRERDPNNIFYYQRNVVSYTDQVLDFFYHLLDMNTYTLNPPVCNSGLYITFFLCSSRFDWQNWFLFPGNSFSEELTSYWLLTPTSQVFSDVNKQPSLGWRCINLKGDIMAESCWWVSNIKIYMLLKKVWFSYVRVSLKQEE